MRFATLCTAAAFLVAVFTMAMWPADANFGTPSKTVAQEDDNPFGGDEDGADPFGPSGSNDTQVAPSTAAPKPRSSMSTATEIAIRRKLEGTCELNYDETSFTDLKEELESVLGINIVLTSSARDDSLTADEVFTCNLRGISYSNALRIMLAEKNATYCIKNGVLQIISLDDAGDSGWFTRNMTDVSDLLALIRHREADRIGKPMTAQASIRKPRAGGGFGSGGGGAFNMQAAQESAGTTQDKNTAISDFEKLAEAIVMVQSKSQPEKPVQLVTAESILLDAVQKLVCQQEWQANAYGGEATIICVGGILIVNAADGVNDKVKDFISDLGYQLQTAQQR